MSKTTQDTPLLRRKPKEGHRDEKGGHRNLIRDYEEEAFDPVEMEESDDER